MKQIAVTVSRKLRRFSCGNHRSWLSGFLSWRKLSSGYRVFKLATELCARTFLISAFLTNQSWNSLARFRCYLTFFLSMSNVSKDFSQGLLMVLMVDVELCQNSFTRRRTRLRTGDQGGRGMMRARGCEMNENLGYRLIETRSARTRKGGSKQFLRPISTHWQRISTKKKKKTARERTAEMINFFILIPNDLMGKVNDERKRKTRHRNPVRFLDPSRTLINRYNLQLFQVNLWYVSVLT